MKKIFYCVIILILNSCLNKSNEVPVNLISNGKKQGLHIQYDSLGRIEIATYVNDSLNGEYILFHENNKRIMRKEIYEKNKEQGQAYYFYSNSSGQLMSQREWKNGKKVGYSTDFYETGETKAVLLYNEEGFLVWRKTFDTLGKVINVEEAQGK